ncbi:MAG: hypothetical protein HZA46_09875 [Planctomycetales bacterium]|nr:hypothetical protein [Planctomycetales bacterium]
MFTRSVCVLTLLVGLSGCGRSPPKPTIATVPKLAIAEVPKPFVATAPQPAIAAVPQPDIADLTDDEQAARDFQQTRIAERKKLRDAVAAAEREVAAAKQNRDKTREERLLQTHNLWVAAKLEQIEAEIAEPSETTGFGTAAMEPPFSAGVLGRLKYPQVRITQVIDSTRVLMQVIRGAESDLSKPARNRELVTVYCEGLDTANFTDDSSQDMRGTFFFAGTIKYETTFATNTVPHLIHIDAAGLRAKYQTARNEALRKPRGANAEQPVAKPVAPPKPVKAAKAAKP